MADPRSGTVLSVVVAVRNQPGYVSRLLRRLEGEDLSKTEIVVSDDASDDCGETLAAISSAVNDCGLGRHVKVLDNKAWGHAGGARNKGLAEAVGGWVWNFDSDDLVLPGAVRRIADMCDSVRGDCDCVYVPYLERSPDGTEEEHLAEMRCVPECWSCAPWSKVVRADKARAVPFREGAHFEDLDWWLGMADILERVECLPGGPCLVYDRTTGGSMDGAEAVWGNRYGPHLSLWELVEEGRIGTNTIADRLALVAALVRLYGRVKRERVRASILRILKAEGDFCP